MGKSDLRVFIGADASNFNKNIKAAQGLLIKFENVAKSVGSSIKTALVGAFAIDSALRFFSTMIEAGRGFEDQMARVKAVSNASSKNFEMMRKEAARLGETTKYSARQAAAALENLVRNGLSATKATKALSSVLQLAGANAIELAEAADIVTNTMNMFEISIDDLNRVNDVLSSTTAKSATNLTDLYEALKYSAPTANLFGILIEEVNAALGILANQGIKGSLAGTTLRNVLNSLVKPSRLAKDILANLGIDEVSIKLDGLLGTLEKLKGLNIEDFVRIFGKEFGGITKALVDRGDLTAALKKELDNSSGEAARMFAEGAGGFNKALDNFTSAFEGAMIKLFDAIEPALTGTVNWFTSLIALLQDGKAMGAGLFTALAGGATYYINKLRGVVKQENELAQAHNNHIDNMNSTIDMIHTFAPTGLENLNINRIKIILGVLEDAPDDFKDLKKALEDIDVSKIENEFYKFEKAYQGLFKGVLSGRDEVVGFASYIRNFEDLRNLGASVLVELAALKRELNSTVDPKETLRIQDRINKLKELERQYKNISKLNFSGAVENATKQFNKSTKGLAFMPKVNIFKKAIGGLGSFIKKSLGAAISFLGGPWVAGITAAVTAVTTLYHQWRKLTSAARDAQAAMKETEVNNKKLLTSFVGIVNELKHLEKGSVAWETRIKHLKSEYPNLVDELRLSEMDIHSTAQAWDELAESMQKVIDRQTKINFAESATKLRDNLNLTYLNNDFGWFGSTYLSKLEKRIEKRYVNNRADKDDAKVLMLFFMQELGTALTQFYKDDANDAKKLFAVDAILKKIDAYFGSNFATPTTGINLVTDYNLKVGKEVQALNRWLNGQTHTNNLTEGSLVQYLEKQTKIFEEQKEAIKKDAELRYPDGGQEHADYIEEQTRQFAGQLLDEILDKFKGVKIQGLNAKDLLQDNKMFIDIANAARRKADDIGTPDPDAEAVFGEELEEAKKEYIKELYAIAEEYHRGYIDEEEFQKKKLDALNSLINVYRQHGDILSKEYALYQANLFELNKVIKDRTDAEKRKAERDEKQYQIDIDRRDAGRDFKSIMNSPFEMETLFDSTQLLEARLGHLKGQLEDLKSLRTSIADMDGLADMTTELDSAIAKLTTHVGELAEKFRQVQLDDFKKEIKDMRLDLDIASYDTFVGFNQGIISIVDACRTLDKLGDSDMDGWERFVTGFQAVISITDTLVSTAESIRSFGKMLEEFGKQKEILSAAEDGSNLKKVAAIEAEAGAVVAAEATKIGAIESKAAANIAAKVAEIKAAEALMAAESAAAYAGIPFAGVGLAAALIAELKALIAASAAFANGGIVGGTSTVGDRVLARVNSGEMILNKRQQGNLFSLLNSGSTGGGTSKVEFKLKGSELVGVLNNYNGKMNKLR